MESSVIGSIRLSCHFTTSSEKVFRFFKIFSIAISNSECDETKQIECGYWNCLKKMSFDARSGNSGETGLSNSKKIVGTPKEAASIAEVELKVM